MEHIFEEVAINNVKPIRDIVYEQLRKAILAGNIKPGERIIEKEYADKLNISRTPVREALRKLEIEGFVEYIPRKGVIAKGFSFKDIIEIYEIRRALETLAVKHVIENIDDAYIDALRDIVKQVDVLEEKGDIEGVFNICKNFHETILKASSMPRLVNMINTLQEYLERFRRVTMSKSSRRLMVIQEHKEILQAIIDKDVERAQELTNEHIDKSKQVFFSEFQVNLD
jgi:DNA-binding GntR family transcriptional regulator